MKTAIFLGAGASKADGAPLQFEIFKEYFKMTGSMRPNGTDNDIQGLLEMFFDKIFDLKIDYKNLNDLKFPSFEEVFAIIDIAEKNGDYFHSINYPGSRFSTRELFVYVIAQTLKESLKGKYDTYHRQLIENLSNHICDIIFISTNYDILIDNAVFDSYPINYFQLDSFDKDSINIYKLHGSLNWLYCPACQSIETFPGEKKASLLGRDMQCEKCKAGMKEIIIPPTYFKNYGNYYLQSVWHNAARKLRDIEHIIFCGYSFPDADVHIKYLLKNAQINRKRDLNNPFTAELPFKKITVINGEENNSEEENRYKRFFGNRIVNFTTMSFEKFSENPLEIINLI